MWLLALLTVAVVFIIVATAKMKIHPFLALLAAALAYGVLCRELSLEEVVRSVNEGFAGTIGQIGIIVLAGTVIGTFLEKSGGAYRLAESTLKAVGKKNVPLAMALIGYVVSIPVFCDSGFVILSPLSKALSRKAKSSLTASAVALSLGLYATHTMVPPTPGPVAAAALIGADLGLVILWGAIVGFIAMAAGWLFAVTLTARVKSENGSAREEPDAIGVDSDAPSALKSVVPILLPIILIVAGSVCQFPTHPFGVGRAAAAVRFFGQPVVALLIGVFFSFLLPKKLTREILSSSGWVGQAVVSAATIIIITGCGGAFGKVLQNSGIDKVVKWYLGESVGLSLWLPFLIAAALKTAQGSSTVAIVTTATIISPLLATLGLETATAKALVVVAIGAGSMVVSHANDSYFWVVTGFSGMTVKQGYRLQTLGTLIEGCAAAGALYVISLIVL
ncbi:MAG: gluconate transporter [Planctomycetes bacterium RBG_16_55_9]|nr:MAG: gluconate transporter [Planctomycetes bacterium RBG_16_55_9]